MRKVILILAVLLLVVGCFGATITWDSTEVGALTVSPPLRYLGFNRTFVFSVAGGTPPYSVSHSGVGSIDPVTLTFSSGGLAGTARLAAADAAGETGVADIVVGTSGQFDASFGTGGSKQVPLGPIAATTTSMVIDSQGRILVAGWIGTGSTADSFVLRLTSSGALDPTFGTNGVAVINLAGAVLEDRTLAMTLDAQERIVLGGLAAENATPPMEGVVARLDSIGGVDLTFGTNGKVYLSAGAVDLEVTAVRIAGNGDIVFSGFESSPNLSVAGRLTAVGSFSTFNSSGGLRTVCQPCQLLGLVLDASENLIQMGITSADAKHVVTNPDGTAELINDPFGGVGSDAARAVARAPDGKYIVAGNFGVDCGVARFTPDFLLETALFGIVFSTVSTCRALAIDPATGDIVVVGALSTDLTTAAARLNSSMAVDTAFGVVGKFEHEFSAGGVESARAVAIDAAGRIVVAGFALASVTEPFVARLTP